MVTGLFFLYTLLQVVSSTFKENLSVLAVWNKPGLPRNPKPGTVPLHTANRAVALPTPRSLERSGIKAMKKLFVLQHMRAIGGVAPEKLHQLLRTEYGTAAQKIKSSDIGVRADYSMCVRGSLK